MIWLTGDTHADAPAFQVRTVKELDSQKRKYLIILGDFGFVWDKADSLALEYLNNQDMKILFIDGNHENFDLLKAYPTKMWYGGEVGVIKPNIYHLKRGQVYNINNKTIFTMGGGISINKYNRIEHKTWWREEEISDEDMEIALCNLEKYNYNIDYVLTHSMPDKFLKTINPNFKSNAVTLKLEELRQRINYKHWYCGHYHRNMSFDKHTILFKQVLKIGDTIC